MLAVKTVLHPTDFSHGSDLAFRLACSLARDYGARLIVLHVVSPPTVIYGEGVVASDPGEQRAEAQERLDQLQVPRGDVRAERRLAEGEAVREILRVAQETSTDLIVMGTRGMTEWKSLLLGGVAIPERHSRRENEHLRLIAKQEAGCRFFVTQVVYDLNAAKNLVSDYRYECETRGLQPVPIVFTFFMGFAFRGAGEDENADNRIPLAVSRRLNRMSRKSASRATSTLNAGAWPCQRILSTLSVQTTRTWPGASGGITSMPGRLQSPARPSASTARRRQW